MTDLPPLPEGFTFEQQAGSGLPPIPAGFSLTPPNVSRPNAARLPGDVGYADIPPAPGQDPPNANASLLSEAGNSIQRSLGSVGHLVLKGTGYYDDPEKGKARAELYNRNMQAIAPAVPDYTHINTAHDAALYGVDKLAGVSKYALAAMAGGLPAMIGLGATEGAAQAAESPNSTPASVATGGALGGATAAIPMPFLKGAPIASATDILKRIAKQSAGFGLFGGAAGATANIPEAVATGNPADALPSKVGMIDSAIGGAIGGAAFGGAHAAVEGAPALAARALGERAPQTSKAPQGNANMRLRERIEDVADQNGFNLRQVKYDAGDGAKAALDQTHNGLASEINSHWNLIKADLASEGALHDPREVGRLEGIIKSARNKLKGRVGDEDIQFLQRTVGHTDEGAYLVDLVRQSNTLTDLFNDGLKGGVSRYTDLLNPLARHGKENSFQSSTLHSALGSIPRVAEAAAIYHNPAVGVPLALGYGAGRAVDAVTGRRSRVAKFVSDNQGSPDPIDFTGTRYSIRGREALQEAQRNQANSADAANQARIAQREAVLRFQNLEDNHPGVGGFYKSIYDQTGLLPQDVARGVFELNRTGRITPQEFNSFFKSPRDLMQGNAGNHVIDMLDRMARQGQLQRDTEWQPTANPSSNPPQVGNNPTAYAAQAAGNQARVTAAMDRVSASEHPPQVKHGINEAIAAIGRTNNRQDAASVRDSLVRSLVPHSPDAARFAHQELDPLIKQIRHATSDAAEGRSIPRGADLRPLTEDATRDGNTLTRTLAAAYKLKSGINKPHYGGKRAPDQGYLKTVAEFHDKAVHAPNDPAVKASYGTLARETIAQFKSLGGLKVETWKGEGEPYRNSKEMMRDVADRHHLWFLPTESAFGANGEAISHPMLAPTGLKTTDGHPLLVNDVFRIVHDFYGHTQHGFQFGPVGEYNAYREHAQMYSDAALPALAAETLAQNAWVNFGPHNPQSLPASQRPFSDQKAYVVPPELLARDPNIGREFVDAIGNDPKAAEIKQAPEPGSNKLHDLIPGFKGIAKYLSPAERDGMLTRTAKLLVEKFTNLPRDAANEMAAVAYSGRAKKGWYNSSAKALVSVFGQEDSPRFAALLAALSPQTSVENNLMNAANVWRGWIEADRPKDQRSIMRILGENVEGDRGPGSVLPAWVNNSVRALTAADGEPITISGPKVTSFMQNLLGEVNEVTNDTWMANWAGIKQETFKGAAIGETDQIGNLYGKGSGYLAMNALTRKAAAILTKKTGETWTPAEVQETVWSWTKALSEKAGGYDPSLNAGVRASAARRNGSSRSAADVVREGDLSHDEINSLPDFEKLFVSDTYARILDLAGYGDYIDNLKDTVSQRQANAGGNGPGGSPFSAEGSGFSQAALNKYLLASAKRLDALKQSPDTGRIANAADYPSVPLKDGEFVLAHHPTVEQANEVAGHITGRPVRVVPHGAGAAVVAGPRPNIEYPTATVPPERAYTDPEGRQGAASFVAGIESPDGTTKGLSTPEIRAVSKSIARLVEGGIPAPGQNGSYSEHNNTVRVYGGLNPDHHGRVLAHETGHAIEALANVVGIMDRGNPEGDRRPSSAAKALNVVKGLQAVSRLERPHLWESDEALAKSYGRPAEVIHEYRNRLDELFADAISFYMRFPAKMKEIAPDAAHFIRDMVNPSKIGKVIAFAGLGSLALPGLIAQALSSLYNQDQETTT